MDVLQLTDSFGFYRIIFLTILCVSMATEVLSDACSSPCTCQMEDEGLLVDCTSRQLTEIPADIPEETVYL